MAHPTFAGFDDRSLLAYFLEHREAGDFDTRRHAHIAWTVLCARQIERMRAYIALFRRKHDHHEPSAEFDDAVLRSAVERLLAGAGEFDGDGLRHFRALVRATARRACADALARGER